MRGVFIVNLQVEINSFPLLIEKIYTPGQYLISEVTYRVFFFWKTLPYTSTPNFSQKLKVVEVLKCFWNDTSFTFKFSWSLRLLENESWKFVFNSTGISYQQITIWNCIYIHCFKPQLTVINHNSLQKG